MEAMAAIEARTQQAQSSGAQVSKPILLALLHVLSSVFVLYAFCKHFSPFVALLSRIREKLEMEAMAAMEARTQQTQRLKNTERGDAEWKVNDPRKRRAVL